MFVWENRLLGLKTALATGSIKVDIWHQAVKFNLCKENLIWKGFSVDRVWTSQKVNSDVRGFILKRRLGLRKREDDRCWCWHDGENSDDVGGMMMICDGHGDEYDRGNRDCWSSPSLISECVGANLSNKDVSYWGEASLFSESLLSRWWLWWES